MGTTHYGVSREVSFNFEILKNHLSIKHIFFLIARILRHFCICWWIFSLIFFIQKHLNQGEKKRLKINFYWYLVLSETSFCKKRLLCNIWKRSNDSDFFFTQHSSLKHFFGSFNALQKTINISKFTNLVFEIFIKHMQNYTIFLSTFFQLIKNSRRHLKWLNKLRNNFKSIIKFLQNLTLASCHTYK